MFIITSFIQICEEWRQLSELFNNNLFNFTSEPPSKEICLSISKVLFMGEENSPSKIRSKKNTILWTLAMVVIFLLAYASGFRSLGDIISTSQRIGWLGVLWVFIAYTLVMLFRAIRWQILLSRANEKIPFHKVLLVAYIAWAQNAFVPARLGEFSRLYYLKRDHDVRIGKNTGTIILEKAFDAIGLAFLLGITAWVVSFQLPVQKNIKLALLFLGVASILGIILLSLYLIYGDKLTSALKKWPKAENLHERFHTPFKEAITQGILDIKTVILTFLLTILQWFTEASTIYLVSLRLGLNISWLAIMLASLFGYATFILPILPGNVGSFEGVIAVVLQGFGVPYEKGFQVPFMTHLLVILYLAITGLLSFLLIETKLRKKEE